MDRLDKTFIEALFTPNYYIAYQAMERHVGNVILDHLHDMNIFRYLQTGYRTVDEISERFNLHIQSKPYLHWMLNYLEFMGYVQRHDSRYVMKPVAVKMDPLENRRQLLSSMPSAEIFIRLATHIAMDMKSFFVGKKSGEDILFASANTANLWYDYFNNNFYGYSLLNYGAAYGITKWFSQTRGKRMLEIGSGTSGATVKVFQMLRDNDLLDSMDTIVLSDIARSLLELGSNNIQKNIKVPPAYTQKILDINKPFREQELSEETFDIIYGVNVLHAARDLVFTLKEIYSHLNKNGILVITETIRSVENRAMHQEFLADLIESYYNVKLDTNIRPYHGFLTKIRWLRSFEKIGFKNIENLVELERNDELDFDIKPLHSFLVIKGQK